MSEQPSELSRTLLDDPGRFLSALVESSYDAIIGKDADGVIRSWNLGAERMYGYTADEAVGRSVAMLAPPELRAEFEDLMERLRRGERIRRFETVRVARGGHRIDVSLTISPILDESGRLVGASTIARDITEIKRTQAFERLVTHAGKVLNAPLDPDVALRRLARITVEWVADYCITYRADAAGEIRRVGLAHARPEMESSLAALEAVHPPGDPRHPARTAVDAGEVVFVPEATPEWTTAWARNAEHLSLIRILCVRSAIVVPLEVRGRRVGALAAGTVNGGRRPFDRRDLPRFHDLARRAALSVDNALLLQRSRASEERLKVAIAAANMGSWEWDLVTGRVWWSEELERIHGREHGSFEGTVEAFRESIHPEDREQVEEALRRAIAGESATYQVEYREAGPARRWFSAQAAVVRDHEGRATRLVGVCSDVTHRKRDEEAIGRERARLADVFERAPASIALLRGADHRFESANPSFQALVGSRPLIGRPIRDALPELDEQVELLDRVWRTGEAEEGSGARLRLLRGPGGGEEEVFLNYVVQPLRGPEGAVTGIFLHCVDVTALVRAREDAEQAVRTRDDVLAYVSHDLRNFLGAIEAGAHALMELTLPPEKQTEGLERMLSASRQALRLIDDLLENARSDQGLLELDPRPLDPGPWAAEVVDAFRDQGRASGVHLELGSTVDLPTIAADPHHLQRVLSNLLSNAIRHSPEGGTVTVALEAIHNEVAFHVTDEGPGIPPDEVDRLFDRYWQAKRAERGAAGLGLAISKAIVEAHGGRIDVESEVGRGSTFTARVPVEARVVEVADEAGAGQSGD